MWWGRAIPQSLWFARPCTRAERHPRLNARRGCVVSWDKLLYLFRIMKKIFTGALVLCAFCAVSACGAGPVQDKRAPGEPGHKHYEIQIRHDDPVGPNEVWVKVSERVWDRCDMGDPYPECAG